MRFHYHMYSVPTCMIWKMEAAPVDHIKVQHLHIISPKRLVEDILEIRTGQLLACKVSRRVRTPWIECSALELIFVES